MKSALGSWLDFWGAILGLPRLPGEADVLYRIRLQNTYATPVGTIDGIVAILQLAFGLNASVIENTGGGYTINLSQPVGSTTLANIFAVLNYIRPVGLPFVVNASAGGLVVNSINYVGGANVTGSYLGSPVRSSLAGAAAYTGPTTSNLPGILLTDPTLWSNP